MRIHEIKPSAAAKPKTPEQSRIDSLKRTVDSARKTLAVERERQRQQREAQRRRTAQQRISQL
jgi:hypothetical protein